jgi:hypothetical protein
VNDTVTIVPPPQSAQPGYRSEAWQAALRGATDVWAHTPIVVPGFLQTEDYARAVAGRYFPDEALAQMIAHRESLLRYWLDEGVRLSVFMSDVFDHLGGMPRSVMQGQIEHLLVMIERGLRFQIVPLGAGAYTGMLSHFLLASDGDRITMSEEGPLDTRITTDQDLTKPVLPLLHGALIRGLPPRDSQAQLESLLTHSG